MKLFLSHLVTIITILVSAIPGKSEHVCDFDRNCLQIYNNMKSVYEEVPSDLTTLCALSHDLGGCMKKASRKCRGDLNYHFFEKLVRDLNTNTGVVKNCAGGMVKGSEENSSNGSSQTSMSSHHEISHHNHHGRNRERARGRINQALDHCAPKVDAPLAGCGLYGLTNLKSFSESLNYTDINYCSLAGAWNLIDTPELSVQITNKGGLSPLPKDITATTLVTVIIKNSECSERKLYQATFDEVPGMFSDGSTTSGNVFIETVTESEHSKIHLPYLSTTIDVIKVLDKIPIPSLAVTIKMPQASAQGFMSEPKRLRGLPLCFYGCPRTATMRPKPLAESSSLSTKSGATSTSSSSSSTNNNNNYYKSKCPNPEVGKGSVDDYELPQADGAPSSVHPSSPASKPQRRRSEDTEFSGSLSAEFLSQSSSFANTDFGGQRSQRSHSSNTAVICASLNSVHAVLLDTVVVGVKLKFPGDGNFIDLYNSQDSNFVSFSSALTSQSSPVSKFHCVFVYLTATLIFAWS
ncbi:uncharacterized protein LOC110852246 [Folsomia candida]|uniref:Repulsive guidance molecule A n=1 Tax=Folsomia candida TaxID=158441 RepID=A0A226E0Y8_FOLCA|nr:uncharacterized protein LOC110852246 [Folsomia candida]XP_021955953.1 uncharacterized protein LOC110852246 [Folsomia candida]XP_021955954.1 uncharacterized protein LOC110852246 [Folsomia candida]OXA51415.1 Repulsive guidance molecule A [Folsomia candida]